MEQMRSAGFQLDKDDLIIDMPEPVSFETGLFVQDEKRYFSESSSAFKPEMVNSLIKTLYTIRVFINPLIDQKVKTYIKLYDILYSPDKWIL